MTTYALSELTDKDQIHAFLIADLNYSAYALGDLEPPYADDATWIAASRTGAIEGLALVYDALDPPVLFLMGEVPAISALLLHGVGPDKVFFTAKPEAEGVLRDFYEIDFLHQMHRMRVTSGSFKALDDYDKHPMRPQHLTEKHVNDVTNLLKETAEADSRDWQDVAFEPAMITGGHFYGIFKENRLVAVGGTHIVVPQVGMAAVGNVMVHPDERRKGLGALVSHAVTQALINANFNLIVLNVRQNNGPAIKVYRKLGYRMVGEFIEGVAKRR